MAKPKSKNPGIMAISNPYRLPWIYENLTDPARDVCIRYPCRLDPDGSKCGLNGIKRRHLKRCGVWKSQMQNRDPVFLCYECLRVSGPVLHNKLCSYCRICGITRITLQLYLSVSQVCRFS